MEKNRMLDWVKYTAKVKVSGIKLALKNNWMRNKFKIGYQIGWGFVDYKAAFTGIQNMFNVV